MTRRLLLATTLALCCSGAPLAGVPADETPGLDHDALDEILRSAVHDGLVDYGFVRSQRAEALDGYLARLATVDPASLDRENRLAFYINLYNASVIAAVAGRAGDGYSVAEDDFALFDRPLVRLDGDTVSLDHLEHSIVRPEFGDPRVHAALVCAARSCPPLLDRAYRGADLDATLDSRMRRFLTDGTRNRVDHDARQLHLSSLFDWYADDFGGRDALDDYVDRWLPRDVRGYTVDFLPYDWRLNAAE